MGVVVRKFVFFFFKQKTAYEMRISDWSSDVCSSDLLLQHFGEQPAFWGDLARRAEALGLTGPLQLTLRYLERLLGMPLPDEIREAAARWQPAAAKRALFDALLLRALLPDHPSCNDGLAGTARWPLYVRAHYLRLPFHLRSEEPRLNSS